MSTFKSLVFFCFSLLLTAALMPGAVNAQNPNGLSIEMTSPRPGQHFSNCSDITLGVNVGIETGEIYRVYYYINGAPIKNSRSEPWEILWEDVPNGIYDLQAKVRDTDKNEVLSDSIQIFVDPIENGDRILNGEFDCGKANWTLYLNTENGADATFDLEEDYGLSDGNAAYIEINNPGIENWHVMLIQNFPIKLDHTYEIYLMAEVFEDKTIGIDFQSTTGDYTVYTFQNIDITDELFYGPVVFTSPADDPTNQFKLALSGNKEPIFLDAVKVIDTGWQPNLTGVNRNNPGQPEKFMLEQNYPNPFNPTTNITFELTQPDEVMLEIFNITGKKTRTLYYHSKFVGRHTIQWSGRDDTGKPVAAGIFFCRMRTSRFEKVIRMVLLK